MHLVQQAKPHVVGVQRAEQLDLSIDVLVDIGQLADEGIGRLAGARVGAARQLEAELGQGSGQVSEIAHTQRVQLAGNGLFILNGGRDIHESDPSTGTM
ncbi:hypothetical protein AAHB60_31725 [Pseudomonas aeruginosa]